MTTKFQKYDRENKVKNPDNYIWGIFYFNKNDDRIFVPKYVTERGHTLNFANPYTWLIMVAFIGILVTIRFLR